MVKICDWMVMFTNNLEEVSPSLVLILMQQISYFVVRQAQEHILNTNISFKVGVDNS